MISLQLMYFTTLSIAKPSKPGNVPLITVGAGLIPALKTTKIPLGSPLQKVLRGFQWVAGSRSRPARHRELARSGEAGGGDFENDIADSFVGSLIMDCR